MGFLSSNRNKGSSAAVEKKTEGKKKRSKARRSASVSNVNANTDKGKDNVLLLSKEAIKELELQEQALPDRWLDFFCIVGLDPEAELGSEKDGTDSNGVSTQKPILLDRYPKEDRPDMEFPVHLPTFCFPDGACRPLRRKERQNGSKSKNSQETKKKKKNEKNTVKYLHNTPDPFLCSMVLTSGSGYRLYCTALTVHEIREEKKNPEEEKKEEEEAKKKEEEARKKEIEDAKKAPPVPEFNKNWWEERDAAPKSKNVKKSKKPPASKRKVKEEYYWIVPKCLVLISHYPFFQAQSAALKELFYTVQSGESPVPFERFVAHIVDDLPLPRSGIKRQPIRQNYTVVEWRSWTEPLCMASKIPPSIRLERPPPNQLPLLNVSMEPLFRTLSLSNILVIWANLLQEGKVVLACSNSETISLLTPIAEALLSLLFPLEWQGIYVPVLPNHDSVLDMLEAPVPYLIGLVTKPTNQYVYNPQTHPNGVLWCDLDNDALHLGFKGDRLFYNHINQSEEEVPLLPALPSEASMMLKAELEEIADPLYLPTFEGIKGRITVGDRTVELDNALRQPYAQRTKLFDEPMATPRKYILTQTAKIPPRGKPLKYEDFAMISKRKRQSAQVDDSTINTKIEEDDVGICGLSLEEIRIPCGEEIMFSDKQLVGQEEKKEDGIVTPTRKPTNNESDAEESSKFSVTNQETTFLTTLKRQSRSVQAHVDRAMAVLGQDYATPSKYAKRHYWEDVLSKQDEIAADFFSIDERETCNITEKVRESFLRFFLVTFSNYKRFFDPDKNRLFADRFVASLNLSYRQEDYVKAVVTTQMFEIFLQDTRSIKNRKLFDEYVIKHRNGDFSIGKKSYTKRSYGTPMLDSSQWQSPTIVVPEQPCCVGLKEGRTYCHDRRFPDKLNPSECVTNHSVSFWRMFCDGAFCSAFSCCN